MTDWYDDDELWIELYPTMFNATKLEEGRRHVDGVLSLVELGEGARVLDLCCGAGRHAIPLAQRGLRVTGVDRTRYFLERARERAAEEGVEVEWVEADMREFVRPESFDLAVSLATSFGYFENPREDLDVLRNLHRALEPGGALVIDVTSKEKVAMTYQGWVTHESPDGSLIVGKPEILDDWTRIRYQWTLIRGDRALRYEGGYMIYSGKELADLLAAAGFVDVKLHGGYDGSSYGVDAERLVAVARKA